MTEHTFTTVASNAKLTRREEGLLADREHLVRELAELRAQVEALDAENLTASNRAEAAEYHEAEMSQAIHDALDAIERAEAFGWEDGVKSAVKILGDAL